MDPVQEFRLRLTRRQLFGRAATGIGVAALGSLLSPEAFASVVAGGALKSTHFPATAKRVIYLFQSGAPSHIDLYDYKPQLQKHYGIDLPASVRMGQRIT